MSIGCVCYWIDFQESTDRSLSALCLLMLAWSTRDGFCTLLLSRSSLRPLKLQCHDFLPLDAKASLQGVLFSSSHFQALLKAKQGHLPYSWVFVFLSGYARIFRSLCLAPQWHSLVLPLRSASLLFSYSVTLHFSQSHHTCLHHPHPSWTCWKISAKPDKERQVRRAN